MVLVPSIKNVHGAKVLGKRHLLIALMLLLLCASQLLAAAHTHTRDVLQHEDCVLCQHQGTSFDSIPVTALTAETLPLCQQVAYYCESAPVRMPGAPRSRSPPRIS